MERNKLYVALAVLAALVVATYFAYRKPSDDGPARVEAPWRSIERDQITKLVIERPNNGGRIELEKRDDKWFMNAPARGPADTQAVNDALEALAGMHVASVATREAASHAEMEVDAAHATHLQLFRGANTAMDIFVGKSLDGGTAVRGTSGPLVYRVDRSIRSQLTKEAREWRDRDVTKLTRDNVRAVVWTNPRGTWRFERNGDTWTAAAANPAVERLDTARVNQIVTNLLEVRATDFAADGANTGLSDASPSVRFEMSSGDPVTLRVGSQNASESEVYVSRSGRDEVFTVNRTRRGEIDLEIAQIQAPVPVEAGAGADASAAPSAAPSAPAAAPGGSAGGNPSIPPEIMEQIRRQLQQRGMQGGPPGGAPPH